MFFDFKRTRGFLTVSSVALTASLFACQPQQTPEASAPPAGSGTTTAQAQSVALSGAGASFPAPLYQRWFSEYNQQNPETQISYQSVGSGAGVQQYLAGTVDFGASDAPLTEEERQQFQAKYNAEPIQVPMTGGAVVFAYNLGGDVENLKLSREAYCGIVTGDITNWNDPQITAENPGVDLPNQKINFVHRSDGSGTTFIFTNHLAEVCSNWSAGAAKTISWPTGSGSKGNEGITAQVQQTPGSIGYVEYAYANENDLNMAVLENQAGQYVEPGPDTAALALEGQQVPSDFALEIPNPTAEEAYPIVGLTWLLFYNDYQDATKPAALQNFVSWALDNGDQTAQELGYLPLSNDLSQRVETTIGQELAP